MPPPRIYRTSNNTHAYKEASPQVDTIELGGIMYKVQFSVSTHETNKLVKEICCRHGREAGLAFKTATMRDEGK